MTLGPAAQILAFTAFASIAVAGALGMTTTMSMFRSGVFLMSSFVGVAGLFVLLLADLLGLLQVMMYVGGMLVMILFMVLFMHDPGGAMMAGMDLPPLERFFSLGLRPRPGSETGGPDKKANRPPGRGTRRGGHPREQGGSMDMSDMSMTTPIKSLAVYLAAGVGFGLALLVLLRPAWRLVDVLPDERSAERIGHLLMGKYMMAFEGAGLLILLGVFGSVLVSRPRRSRAPGDRKSPRAAVDARPTPVAEEGVPSDALTKRESEGAP
ncbi:MAG: NADH-quinone oxidoreductase subunit J [Acidobacteriota bacterium]|nr:NADH-quinone oxidoreductase subunit J [Acidobacteriota bacterium]